MIGRVLLNTWWVCSLFFLFYTVYIGISGYFRYNKFHDELIDKQQYLMMLKTKHDHVIKKVATLKHDDAWERLSRETLKMVRQGETAHVFYHNHRETNDDK